MSKRLNVKLNYGKYKFSNSKVDLCKEKLD